MSWKKLLIPALGLPIVALLAFGLTRDPNIVESPLPGREAFAFAGATLEGDSLRLTDLRGNVIVLNFWASWCVACIDEHAVFVEAERRYADRPFQMLGVVYQDTPENARRWMRRMGGTWPSLMDPNSRIAIDYGVYGVPETYFIGMDGRIAYKHIGPVNRRLMGEWVERLLAQSPELEVTAAETPDDEMRVGRSPGYQEAAGGSSPDPERSGSGS